MELFKAARQRSGKSNIYENFYNKAERTLAEAQKDNDFIYHERIPDINNVEPIGKAQIAKVLSPSHPMSQNFRGELAVHNYCFKN